MNAIKMIRMGLMICCLLASTQAAKKLPDNFLLGAGTSAFQIEGAWNVDGKGESMWDRYLHQQNAPENGDIACDSYNKWQEDIAHAKVLGLDFYRFSISWPRILPNGSLNHVNQAGVDYYQNLINGLLDEGIQPAVTIYHWDMPQHLYDLGGYMNPQFVDYFEDYARLLFKLYGSKVKIWFTVNEPIMICGGGYEWGILAPGLMLSGDGLYQCSYTLLKAHARAWRIYDEEFRHLYNGEVGIVINFDYIEAASSSPEDLKAQERFTEFLLGWWANPIFLGNWPQLMIDRIAMRSKLEGLTRSRLPSFTQEEIKYINGTSDFFGLNTYGVRRIHWTPEPPIGVPSYATDVGVDIRYANASYYDPKKVRETVNHIQKKYNPKRILITENGQQSEDELDDTARVLFVEEYLSNLVDAVVLDGVRVFGYCIWSFMDDFEWASYKTKYGIIRVDFDDPDRKRTWKKSAYWYKKLIATRQLDV